MTTRANVKYDTGDERISQRLIDGVRVIEKETHRIIKLVGGRYIDAALRPEPRLVVVDDAGANPDSFITKDRSSIAGLNAFFRGVNRSPATSK